MVATTVTLVLGAAPPRLRYRGSDERRSFRRARLHLSMPRAVARPRARRRGGDSGAAPADGCFHQRLRRSTRARARGPRADSYRELACGRSGRVVVRHRSAPPHAELRHGGGTAQVQPDVVLAGIYTSPFTRSMLRRLGYHVVELAPEASVADIERNVRLVAELLGQTARGEQVRRTVARQRAPASKRTGPRAHWQRSSCDPAASPSARTICSHELLLLAGLRNVAAEQGLDRWGSLSMEALLRSAPELIVLTGYRSAQPSLANAVLEHPALRRLGALHDRARYRRRCGRAVCRAVSNRRRLAPAGRAAVSVTADDARAAAVGARHCARRARLACRRRCRYSSAATAAGRRSASAARSSRTCIFTEIRLPRTLLARARRRHARACAAPRCKACCAIRSPSPG